APPRFRLALRLDHGRRQPRAIPSLATLAAHCDASADRGNRSPSTKFPRPCRTRCAGTRALPVARERGRKARRSPCAGLGISDRAETESFVDDLAEPRRELEERELNVCECGGLDIESINPTCVEWSAGIRIRSPAIQRKEWSLTTSVLS